MSSVLTLCMSSISRAVGDGEGAHHCIVLVCDFVRFDLFDLRVRLERNARFVFVCLFALQDELLFL